MPDKSSVPTDAPPSYDVATGGSSASSKNPNTSNASSHLNVPGASSSSSSSSTRPTLSATQRRSMEDEHRPLPKGWVRTYDSESSHQFFVDTTKDPPRSIWHHPYDDERYLATLSSEERERIEQESLHRGANPNHADIMAAHSDDDSHSTHEHIPAELPPRDGGKGKAAAGSSSGAGGDTRSFGRKFKDKVTGSTHEERVKERERRAEADRRAYEQQQRVRRAMAEAAQTGRPVLLGKDRDGKDVYVEPPASADPYYNPYGAYGGGYGGGFGGGFGGGYGGGVYTQGNSRYIRPAAPYARPAGYGYGGGYGLPLAGGLLGGLLLGDLLF